MSGNTGDEMVLAERTIRAQKEGADASGLGLPRRLFGMVRASTVGSLLASRGWLFNQHYGLYDPIYGLLI
jgi:hypothetical protein